MPIKDNTVDMILYKDWYKPESIADRAIKVIGYKEETKSGEALSFDDTYNDTPVSFQVTGNRTQLVSVKGTNLITNGNFASDLNGDGIADYFTSGMPVKSVSNNVQSFTPNAPYQSFVATVPTKIIGHTYYLAGYFKTTVANFSFLIYTGASWAGAAPSTDNTWHRYSLRGTLVTGGTPYFYIQCNATGVYGEMQTKNWILLDLTAIFGAGKEPTAAQIDTMLSQYTNSWFDGKAVLTTDVTTYTANSPSTDYSSPIYYAGRRKNLYPFENVQHLLNNNYERVTNLKAGTYTFSLQSISNANTWRFIYYLFKGGVIVEDVPSTTVTVHLRSVKGVYFHPVLKGYLWGDNRTYLDDVITLDDDYEVKWDIWYGDSTSATIGNQPQIELGSIKTPFETFYTLGNLQARSKNRFDCSAATWATNGGTLLENTADIIRVGSTVAYGGIRLILPANILPIGGGLSYVLRLKVRGEGLNVPAWVTVYDVSNATYIVPSSRHAIVSDGAWHEIIVPFTWNRTSNSVYVWCINYGGGATYQGTISVDKKSVQIEYGSTVTDPHPFYGAQDIVIPTLRGAEDIWNPITGALDRGWVEKVFNGTETFVTTAHPYKFRYTYGIAEILPMYYGALCTHFKMAPELGFAAIQTVCFATHPTQNQIDFFTDFPTVADFKAWLATQSMKVCYRRAAAVPDNQQPITVKTFPRRTEYTQDGAVKGNLTATVRVIDR